MRASICRVYPTATLSDKSVAARIVPASAAPCELKFRASDLRQRIAGGIRVTRHAVVIEAFALLTEAVRRTHAKLYYDVQLLRGLALASDAIA